MKQKAALIGCLFLLIALSATGSTGRDVAVPHAMSAMHVQKCTQTANGYTLSISFDEPTLKTLDEAESLQLATLTGRGMRLNPGEPATPLAGGLFRLPPSGGVSVEVLDTEYYTLTDINYAAISGELDEIQYVACSLSRDAWYPGELAEVGEPVIFHDFRVANLLTNPVQVNPARNEVRVFTHMDITVRFEGTDNRNALTTPPTRISRSMLPFYRTFLDWDIDELDEFDLYRGAVQVVMCDDSTLKSYMEDWFQWKREKGWTLELLTDAEVEWTPAGIREELQTRYAEEPFDYVVIVGDDDGMFSVPPSISPGLGAGDLLFSCLAGDDDVPDVGIGRISIGFEFQAERVFNKLVFYERTPYMVDTSWYLRGLVHRTDGHDSFCEREEVLHQTRRQMLDIGYTAVDTLFELNAAFAVDYLENGVTFYNHVGYIGDGLLPAAINSLDNAFKPPVVSTILEYSGNWSQNIALTEEWLRASHGEIPKGAIGAFGMATSATSPDKQNVLLIGEMYSATVLRNPALGDMTLSATLALYNNYGTIQHTNYYNNAMYHNLMGDPTTWIWTGVPQQPVVQTDETLQLGLQTLVCMVMDQNGQAVNGAWVTLVKDDNGDNRVFTAETDSTGLVNLQYDIRHSGSATFTVTAQNFLPYQQTMDVVSGDIAIGLDDVLFFEDGSHESIGDGDGIAEAGEVVALQCRLENFGDNTIEGATLTCSSNDMYISNLAGSIQYVAIEPGDTPLGTGYILASIAPDTPDRWLSNLRFLVLAGQESTICYQLPVSAPELRVVSAVQADAFDLVDITVPLQNTGHGDLSGSTAHLLSGNAYVDVVDNMATINSLPPGDTTNIAFSVTINENCIHGYPAPMVIEVLLQNGHEIRIPFTLVLGTAQPDDPTGPDRYGYMAFDNSDTRYLQYAPVFDWIEINPATDNYDYMGQFLALLDTAENMDDDTNIHLPFDVQYYGSTFNTITITTNGIAAFGDQRQLDFMRNRIIPDPLGPGNMLAPYWDNFEMDPTTAILTYFDSNNGRFIIEWSNMFWHNEYWTFEIILYDQEVHPTISGDTDILFQYLSIPDYLGSHCSYDIHGCTVGIENDTQDDGIQYLFATQYASGAAEIDSGRTILFTSSVVRNRSTILGHVLTFADSSPVSRAIVSIENELSVETDDAGYFLINNISHGDHRLTVEAECFADLDTLVEVQLSDLLELELLVFSPDYDFDSFLIADTLDTGGSATHIVSLSNPGTGELDYAIHIESHHDAGQVHKNSNRITNELDQLWDRVAGFGLDTGESSYHGLAYDGESFWITGSNGTDTEGPNKLYLYSSEGEFLETFDQPVSANNRSDVGIMGIDYDDGVLYGVDNNILYAMTIAPHGLMVDYSIPVPVNASRYLAVDPERGVYWLGNLGFPLCGINLNGQTEYEIQTGSYRLLGGDLLPVESGATASQIAFLNWSISDEVAEMVLFNPVTEIFQPDPDFPSGLIENMPTGCCIMHTFSGSQWTFASIVSFEEQDSVFIWEIGPFTQWIYMPVATGTLLPNATTDLEVVLSALNLEPYTYTADLVLYSNACSNNANRIAVEMTIPGEDVETPDYEHPLEWKLDAIWPNPFNPTARIRYGIKEATSVDIRVYDILGREVTVLAHEQQAAGWYTVPFTANDFASGVYFMQINAGPLHETRKMILLK